MSEQTAYLAPLGYEDLLLQELKNVSNIMGRIVLARGEPQQVLWAQNIWYDPKLIAISSIGDAARQLRAIQRNWFPYKFSHFRRMEHIQEKLPYISAKPLDFLASIPTSALGSWTLVDDQTMLAASACSSPMPNGEWNFNEDKIHPPSRAYLKLWEFFTRFRGYPNRKDCCLDLGASPGGWTWVLAQLAGEVIACDRSPLASSLLDLDNVKYISGDAFKMRLADYPQVSWVFSDVICYPDKLYDFIAELLNQYPNKKYVFTIKFQGRDHADIISRFAALPGSLVHLSHNKHELTWFKI